MMLTNKKFFVRTLASLYCIGLAGRQEMGDSQPEGHAEWQDEQKQEQQLIQEKVSFKL